MKHLHILDPQLLDEGGHYLNYCSLVVREMRRRNIPVSIYARRGCRVECEGVRPAPVFSHDIFTEVGRDPEVWALENFHALNHSFASDLSRIDTSRFTADDLLFFPSLNQNQLYGVALWLARIPAPQRPAVAVLLRYLTHEMDYVKGRANHGMLAHHFRYAARVLLSTQPRARFFADTREMREAFQGVLGIPVTEVSVAMDPPVVPASDPSGTRLNVTFVGHASQLKGFHLLPEIIRDSLRFAPRPRFTVQIQNGGQRGFDSLIQWLRKQSSESLTLVEGAQSAEAYYSLLAKADIVLLPYAPTFYGRCSSGVFAEAAAMGKVIVVPAATVAARQGREGDLGVVAAAAWTGPALAVAVGQAIGNYKGLLSKARAGAPRFRAEQSVEAFWTKLLAAFAEDAKALAA